MIEVISPESPEALFYAVFTLNLLFATGVWCVVKPSVRSITALTASAIAWPIVNGPLEGHLIWTLDASHGLTVSDFVSVLAFIVAVAKLRELLSNGRRRRKD